MNTHDGEQTFAKTANQFEHLAFEPPGSTAVRDSAIKMKQLEKS